MSDFKAKKHKIRSPLGLRPRSSWGAYSAPPALLAVFKGPTSKEEGEEEGGMEQGDDTIRYDTRCYFNVRSKADISQLNLPHGTGRQLKKCKNRKTKK